RGGQKCFDHPVCASRLLRSIFSGCAASPPLEEGNRSILKGSSRSATARRLTPRTAINKLSKFMQVRSEVRFSKKMRTQTLALLFGFVLHHSLAGMYDSSREIKMDGVVSEFHFVNPHPFLVVDVQQQ